MLPLKLAPSKDELLLAIGTELAQKCYLKCHYLQPINISAFLLNYIGQCHNEPKITTTNPNSAGLTITVELEARTLAFSCQLRMNELSQASGAIEYTKCPICYDHYCRLLFYTVSDTAKLLKLIYSALLAKIQIYYVKTGPEQLNERNI